MKNVKIPAALLGVALLLCCFSTAASAQETDGKAVFEAQKCNLCHAVSTAGIEATTKKDDEKGPDLAGVGEKYQPRWIARYLKKSTDKDGKSHTKPFKGSDEELQALVDWLLEQKSE